MNSLIDATTLRALRQARGWDQKTLADRAGIDPSAISRLERGLQDNITASALVSLAQTLDVSVDALLVPYRQAPPVEPSHELGVVVTELASLSEEHQRIATGILWGFLSALSGKTSSDVDTDPAPRQ